MELKTTQRHACRCCGEAELRRFLRFPDYPFPDNHLSSPDSKDEVLLDFEGYWCPRCQLVQTQLDVDWAAYYSDYDYTVSTSGMARGFMSALADELVRRYDVRPGDSALEIGSGDGYQLACLREHGLRVFGFEPGKALALSASRQGIPTAACCFGRDALQQLPDDISPVQLIVACYTLDHMPDPVTALKTMAEILDPDRGVIAIEVHDLAEIIARKEACLFVHEHPIYLSEATIAGLLKRAGLRLLDTSLIPAGQRRGNSLLVTAMHKDSSLTPAADSADSRPLGGDLQNWQTYRQFGDDVHASYSRLRDYVKTKVAAGRRLGGYGAAGRAIASCALAGLTAQDIAYTCDRNPNLHGKFLPFSHVPVVPPDHVLRDPVDELLVFSYGYLSEIRVALNAFVERGGVLTNFLDVLQPADGC